MYDDYIFQVVKSDATTEQLDMTYFAQYNPSLGFKVSVDGVHNTPNAVPYAVIMSLNPPGDFYVEERKQDADVGLVCNCDWNSPVRSIRFKEGFSAFRDVPGKPSTVIVFEVRSVESSSVKINFKDAGWTVLPVFVKENKKVYIRSGYYQLPLLRGPVNAEVIKEMAKYEDPLKYLTSVSKKKKIYPADPFCILVRLLDG